MITPTTIIKNLENRLQFTIVMVLFFPTFLGSLTLYAKDPTGFLKTILSWNVIIGLFVIIYIIIEILKNVKDSFAKKWISKWINYLLLIETGSFLPLFFLGAMESIHYKILITIYKDLVLASVFCMVFIPIVIIILFVINFALYKPDPQA